MITEKVYIGQTWRKLEERIEEHFDNARRNKLNTTPKLVYAIRKYDPTFEMRNFEYAILESVSSDQKNLDEREAYWINQYDSIESGYNLKEGGYGGRHSEETREKMRTARRGSKSYFYGRHHTEEAKEKMRRKKIGIYPLSEEQKIQIAIKQQKKIYQLDLSGNVVNIFDSIKTAAQTVGVNDTNITRAAKSETRTSAGFVWRYENELEKKLSNVKKRSIVQFDKNQKAINVFESMASASAFTGIDPSQIMRVAQGKNLTAGGFTWKYKEEVLV